MCNERQNKTALWTNHRKVSTKQSERTFLRKKHHSKSHPSMLTTEKMSFFTEDCPHGKLFTWCNERQNKTAIESNHRKVSTKQLKGQLYGKNITPKINFQC